MLAFIEKVKMELPLPINSFYSAICFETLLSVRDIVAEVDKRACCPHGAYDPATEIKYVT